MSVDFERHEYARWYPKWQMIEDITEGKDLRQYLRKLRDTGNHEDEIRQRDYADNAIFYGVAGHTLKGLVGTAFRKAPSFAPNTGLEHLLVNADGHGNNIDQIAKAAVSDALRFGRLGLWVDFPPNDGDLSRAQMTDHFATIHPVRAGQIINWSTRRSGSRNVLDLLTFRFAEEVQDGFEIYDAQAIRELALEDIEDVGTIYVTRKWMRNEKKQWVVVEQNIPRDGQGNPLTEIPFTFVGAQDNDPKIDVPPMLDIVRINIGHYRNSADFEDSVFYAGQSQPWMSGADTAFMEAMEEHNVFIGSRTLMPVPENGTFGFATPDPNPVVRQAMLDKVEMMIGLGARFIKPGGQAKTATEASMDQETSTSILSSVVMNVSDAISAAVGQAALFMNAEPAPYVMDDDFSDIGANPQMLAAWVQSYIQGAVPESDYIGWMQRQGFFDPEKEQDEISQELGEVTQASGLN